MRPRRILVVPDDEAETIAVAHSLTPNYVGRPDTDLDTVVAVLRRLIERRTRRPGSAESSGANNAG